MYLLNLNSYKFDLNFKVLRAINLACWLNKCTLRAKVTDRNNSKSKVTDRNKTCLLSYLCNMCIISVFQLSFKIQANI